MNRDDRRNFQQRRGSIDKLASKWANFAHSHQTMMESNPFNEDYQGPKEIFKKGDANWGVPQGKTLERGVKAHQYIIKEIQNLLDVMIGMAQVDKASKKFYVTFKQIFDRYVRISDKVVGLLMRAKKRKCVSFDAEMLWQGRDDNVKIFIEKVTVEAQGPKLRRVRIN